MEGVGGAAAAAGSTSTRYVHNSCRLLLRPFGRRSSPKNEEDVWGTAFFSFFKTCCIVYRFALKLYGCPSWDAVEFQHFHVKISSKLYEHVFWIRNARCMTSGVLLVCVEVIWVPEMKARPDNDQPFLGSYDGSRNPDEKSNGGIRPRPTSGRWRVPLSASQQQPFVANLWLRTGILRKAVSPPVLEGTTSVFFSYFSSDLSNNFADEWGAVETPHSC